MERDFGMSPASRTRVQALLREGKIHDEELPGLED
jgi:hypothetical protein